MASLGAAVRHARRYAEAGVFALLSVVATWPLVRHISTHVPGDNLFNGRVVFFESATNLWNLWWVRYALFELKQNPFDCRYVFFPFGADLWLHTLSPLPAAVGAVMQPIVGLVATQNLFVLLSFVAAGLSASALARYLGLERSAATLAGALYAFTPAVLAHLYVGHFELLWIFWMPAVLLVFLRLLDRPDERDGWRRATLLGLLLIGACYSSQYYAVYSVELLLLTALVRWRAVVRTVVLKRLAWAALVVALGIEPLVVHVVAREETSSLEDTRSSFHELGLEPLDLIAPSFMHPVLSRFERTRDRLPQESTGYLGLTAIALAAAALGGRRRPSDPARRTRSIDLRLPATIAVVFAMLSFGAAIKIPGRSAAIPMPTAVLAELPILRQARAPGRHVVLAALGVSILAAAGWQRVPRRGWRAALLFAMAFEFWPAVPLFNVHVDEIYYRLASEPGRFGILDVPAGMRDGTRVLGQADSSHLLAQTVHHKPIVGGMVSRLSNDTWKAASSAPLVRTLLDRSDPSPATPEEVAAYFNHWRIRAIVVQPDAPDRDRQLIEASLTIVRRERFSDGAELWWLR
jgi:hypothetical protein